MSNTNITQLILGIISLALTWATARLSSYIKTKGEAVKIANKHTVLDKYIDIVEKIVINTVAAENVTIVNDLKKASEDGKLDKNDAEQILNDVIATIIDSISPEVQYVLNDVFGDLPTWLTSKIIIAVEAEKKISGSGIQSVKAQWSKGYSSIEPLTSVIKGMVESGDLSSDNIQVIKNPSNPLQEVPINVGKAEGQCAVNPISDVIKPVSVIGVDVSKEVVDPNYDVKVAVKSENVGEPKGEATASTIYLKEKLDDQSKAQN